MIVLQVGSLSFCGSYAEIRASGEPSLGRAVPAELGCPLRGEFWPEGCLSFITPENGRSAYPVGSASYNIW